MAAKGRIADRVMASSTWELFSLDMMFCEIICSTFWLVTGNSFNSNFSVFDCIKFWYYCCFIPFLLFHFNLYPFRFFTFEYTWACLSLFLAWKECRNRAHGDFVFVIYVYMPRIFKYISYFVFEAGRPKIFVFVFWKKSFSLKKFYFVNNLNDSI